MGCQSSWSWAKSVDRKRMACRVAMMTAAGANMPLDAPFGKLGERMAMVNVDLAATKTDRYPNGMKATDNVLFGRGKPARCRGDADSAGFPDGSQRPEAAGLSGNCDAATCGVLGAAGASESRACRNASAVDCV